MSDCYGDQTCRRCGKAPIATTPDRTAPKSTWHRTYLTKPNGDRYFENVFFPMIPHPKSLCEYCDRVERGLFNLVPIVDIVRKLRNGLPLSNEERSRYRQHLTVLAEDEVWHR